MLLKVVGVGPQRTGTSWLYTHLRKHPRLCFPERVKETFFFDERFHKGWSWYQSHFQHGLDDRLCIEFGPGYFDVPEAADRIRQHNPACRIIVNLRDPVARSHSLYLHHKKLGNLNCDFKDAIRKMPRIIHSSHYRVHLNRWFKIFPKEQILIILLDDISSSPEAVIGKVCKFIGINPVPLSSLERERINAASLPAFPALAKLSRRGAQWLRDRRMYGPIQFAKKIGLKRVFTGRSALPALDRETRKGLIEEFEPDIAYVEQLLGRPLPEWRS